jgi:hypothetical protein
MSIIEDIKGIQPVAAPQNTWVKDLIDKRFQPQQERVKRTPVGFNFVRDPFDPSSYYNQLGSYRDISRAATEVVKQQSFNKEADEQKAAALANQKAMDKALQNITGKITYSKVAPTGSVGTSGGGGATHNYKLKGITSNTSAAANYFGSRYGIKNIGGYREHGSVPGSDHPKGRALDFMTSNVSKGNALANDLIKNYKAWNVKYVIWNRYIWQPGRGWKKYSGPSAHTDHVHASFNK